MRLTRSRTAGFSGVSVVCYHGFACDSISSLEPIRVSTLDPRKPGPRRPHDTPSRVRPKPDVRACPVLSREDVTDDGCMPCVGKERHSSPITTAGAGCSRSHAPRVSLLKRYIHDQLLARMGLRVNDVTSNMASLV